MTDEMRAALAKRGVIWGARNAAELKKLRRELKRPVTHAVPQEWDNSRRTRVVINGDSSAFKVFVRAAE